MKPPTPLPEPLLWDESDSRDGIALLDARRGVVHW
jgi:hypothetical protein